MTEKNLVTAVRDALHDEMAADDRVILLGEDVGNRGGVFRISVGWMEEFGEERVIDTPLAESGIVGSSTISSSSASRRTFSFWLVAVSSFFSIRRRLARPCAVAIASSNRSTTSSVTFAT